MTLLHPLSIAVPLFCFLNTFTATVSNPTNFRDDVSINCGCIGTSKAAHSDKEWIGDVLTKSSSTVQIKGSSTTSTVARRSFSSDPVPYKTARISQSQFSYAFQVSPGQKILRLHFNPTTYKGFKGFKDLFTVEAGPFTLLGNFSASLTARALAVDSFAKEFCLNIQENQQLNIIFSPESSQSLDTYAFINGIEIFSVPASLSYFQDGDIGLQLVGEKSPVYVDYNTALEIIHRIEIKQNDVLPPRGSDDMFPKWANQNAKKRNNNTWKMPVDVGFKYLIRVHFSELGLKIARNGDLMFKVLINEMIAHTNIDLVKERDGNNIPWYRDYMVMVRGNKKEGKRRILISLQSYDDLIEGHALYSGFEVFKLSNYENSLASPNHMPPSRGSPSHTIQTLSSILYHRNAIANVAIAIISLGCIIAHQLREIREANITDEQYKPKPKPSARAERLCRRFSLDEIQLATKNFSDTLLIGRGGFGKVYKGDIDRGEVTVAVKRLKSSSKQGAREFLTEIETLSEVRHVNLVSLIGYCNEQGEMILVYEYMPHGTLADHLYKLLRENNTCSSLTWKQRLDICIGAGRGLDYLHTGHGVIHRDVKASNILLDENFIAKVSDFGLAKTENKSKLQTHISTNVKGTFGYLNPNYFSTRKLTRKSDTYAFGVVLLEVLCGRPAVDLMVAEDERVLSMWARDKINKGEADQIVSTSLREEISPNSLETFAGVAQRCLSDDLKKRPTMSQVVSQLELAVEQQETKQPLEKAAKSVSNDNHCPNNGDHLSVQTGQSTISSTAAQGLPPPPEEQTNSKAVSAQLPSAGEKHGRSARRHMTSLLRPWELFWKRGIRDNDITLAKFDWKTIAAATNQFTSSNKVAEGDFGPVYKAVLPTGQVVIVNFFSICSTQRIEEFKDEILPLQHPNIIKPLGYCIHREQILLLYEFMENKSLRDIFIPGINGKQCQRIQWPVRFKIVMGIARGLIYLHQDSGVAIIHRDLKPSNILLDSEMNPKISNFALASFFLGHPENTRFIEAYGYMSPEYALHGIFSMKSDVYSFGIIVLEMVIGTMGNTPSLEYMMYAVDYAWKLWNEGNPLDMVDKSLGGLFPADEVLRCIQVGLLCTEKQPHLRPTMPSVVEMLAGEELIVKPQEPWPVRPIQFSACSSVGADDGLDSNATFELDDTLER